MKQNLLLELPEQYRKILFKGNIKVTFSKEENIWIVESLEKSQIESLEISENKIKNNTFDEYSCLNGANIIIIEK